MAKENLKSYLTGISHTVVSVLAAYSHTLDLLMSKSRSSLEAGKKQANRSLEYGYSVVETLLSPSLGASLVCLWITSDEYVTKKIGWSMLTVRLPAILQRKRYISYYFRFAHIND